MARLDFQAALDLLEDARTVAICGHVNPDGDSLGSVLALTLALRQTGRDVTPLLATHDAACAYDFLEGYADLVPARDYHVTPDVFISVDVPGIARTADAESVFKRARHTIAIDHHQGPADFADANFVDEHAAAAGMLVWDFIEQGGFEVTPAIATCCYTALVTDTGRFQFQNTDARALRAAAQMTEAGADPSEIARCVYQRASLAALKLRSLAIQRMETACAGKAVVSWVTQKDFADLGASADDAESLIDVIRQLGGIEVALMLREQGAVVRGSIRSKTSRDVAAIARQLSGGGHKAAAGFTFKGSIEQARAAVLELLEQSFADCPSASPATDDEITRTMAFHPVGEPGQ